MSLFHWIQPAAYIICYFIVSWSGTILYGLLLYYYCWQVTPTDTIMLQLSELFRCYSFVLVPLWCCYTGFATASLIYWLEGDFMDRLRPYRIAYGWFTLAFYLIFQLIVALRKQIEEAAHGVLLGSN